MPSHVDMQNNIIVMGRALLHLRNLLNKHLPSAGYTEYRHWDGCLVYGWKYSYIHIDHIYWRTSSSDTSNSTGKYFVEGSNYVSQTFWVA